MTWKVSSAKPGARGVDLGVQDVEAGGIEVAADAREEVGPVGRIDQHLQALAHGRGRARTTGTVVSDMAPQRPCVPGQLGRVVAGKVADRQRLPQRRLGAGQHGVQRQGLPRLPACGLDLGVKVQGRAAQRAAVRRNRSSSSLPFQAFQTLGLVPRMSATVSR